MSNFFLTSFEICCFCCFLPFFEIFAQLQVIVSSPLLIAYISSYMHQNFIGLFYFTKRIKNIHFSIIFHMLDSLGKQTKSARNWPPTPYFGPKIWKKIYRRLHHVLQNVQFFFSQEKKFSCRNPQIMNIQKMWNSMFFRPFLPKLILR